MSIVFALTQLRFSLLADHIARQPHAMAGATTAASAALACSLGEACLRINALEQNGAEVQRTLQMSAERVSEIRGRLLDLADTDGAAITTFTAVGVTGDDLRMQKSLCSMPVEIAQLSIEAALMFQECRPLAVRAQDDLEMALVLLDGAAHAATLLLDSNLRIWADAQLLDEFDPKLDELLEQLTQVQPVARIRA